MRRGATIAALGLVLAGLALGGGASVGRTLMALGLPGVAAPPMGPSDWQGAARYRAGDFAGAAVAYRAADAPLGAGLSLARAGDYAAALEALDIARARGQPGADAAFDLVAAYYAGLSLDPDSIVDMRKEREGPVVAAPLGEGSGRAASTGDARTNARTSAGLPEVESRGRLGVRKVFDDRFVAASPRWLANLPDVPGAYLAARIRAERKDREAAAR